jgi:uncharacterized protein
MPETPPLYSARPGVALDGVDKPELSQGLIAALVEETSDGLSRCEVTVGNWGTANGSVDYLYSDRRLLNFGKLLSVRMGAGDKAAEVFKGRITGLQADFPAARSPEMVVLAEDRFQDLRMTRRTRTFEQATVAEVARRVAADHGLRAEVDLDSAGHPVLAQVNQSDLAFLREVAQRVDAEVWVEGDVLHAQARARRSGRPLTVTYGRELREMSMLADLAGQRTAVAVSGWDVSAKEALDAEATEAVMQGELQGVSSGVAILGRTFGTRKERLMHTVPLTSREATAMAEAALRRSARRFVTGQGLTEGDGRIRVGSTIELIGLGAAFNGRHHVSRVKHQFDPVRGYLTYFEVERPGLPEG